MRVLALSLFLIVTLLTAPIPAHADRPTSPHMHAKRAVGEDAEAAAESIAFLRRMGAKGLAIFMEVHRDALDKTVLGPAVEAPAEAHHLHAVLDKVAGQHDAIGARLFWYTDLAQARAVSAREKKPILYLRLLGRLDEGISCANSRFFRKTLYTNAEVRRRLAERFVLAWSSVRPVPRITIDFGGGRLIERTITGNSAHYALNQLGEVLDVMPGLYAAPDFAAWLDRMQAGFEASQLAPHQAYVERTDRWRRGLLADIAKRWEADAASIGLPTPVPTVHGRKLTSDERLDARLDSLTAAMTDEAYAKIAALRAAHPSLDESARRFIKRTHPSAARAGARAASKRIVEDPMLRLFHRLERSIAEDTVRNEYMLHVRALRELRRWKVTQHDRFDRWVYDELFLTPRDDPWLGLVDPTAYDAMPLPKRR